MNSPRRLPIAYLIGTALLCGLGLWFAVTGRARFALGGDQDSPARRNGVIHVDARGADAVAVGGFFVALGILNLAQGIRSRRRIPVFWTGAGLLCAAVLYGAVQAVLAVVR
jgi:hypothetical protein